MRFTPAELPLVRVLVLVSLQAVRVERPCRLTTISGALDQRTQRSGAKSAFFPIENSPNDAKVLTGVDLAVPRGPHGVCQMDECGHVLHPACGDRWVRVHVEGAAVSTCRNLSTQHHYVL